MKKISNKLKKESTYEALENPWGKGSNIFRMDGKKEKRVYNYNPEIRIASDFSKTNKQKTFKIEKNF